MSLPPFFLNQFLGFKYDLYLSIICLPSSKPPVQNNISATITQAVVMKTLFLSVVSIKGMRSKNAKISVDTITNTNPSLNFQFFFSKGAIMT